MKREKLRVEIDTMFSRDDAGWYCEVFDPVGGSTLFTTEVHKRERDAMEEASNWVIAKGFKS